MKKLTKWLSTALAVILAMTAFVALMTACDEPEIDLPDPTPYGVFEAKDFISTYGSVLRTDYGYGEEITLRGVNAGGYLLLEQWMCAVRNEQGTRSLDHKYITETFVSRFGATTTLDLWEFYRSRFWTEKDFKKCAEMGMNAIRLPFSYMSVDPEFNNVPKIEGEKYNFSVLDNFIRRAAEYGIYTILDLHGAYGSQNGKDHSGEIISDYGAIDFYSNEEKMTKTIDLWGALADRYKDNPAVAAYDILNEPGENTASGISTTTTRHFQFFDRVYDAIREVDMMHPIIMESCWTGSDLPKPSTYGWENVIYSFHHYTGTSNYNSHYSSMVSRVNEVNNKKFNVPIFMGEFSNYANEDSWVDTLKLLNENKWSWTTWTYKLNRNNDTSYAGWGIYFTRAEEVVPTQDTVEQIKTKWTRIITDDSATVAHAFESGVTQRDIIKEACNWTEDEGAA